MPVWCIIYALCGLPGFTYRGADGCGACWARLGVGRVIINPRAFGDVSMSEADLQKKITKWLKRGGAEFLCKRYGITAAGFETKVCKGERMGFSQLSEGQEIALARAAGIEGADYLRAPVVHKISDMARGYKPFDGFFMMGCGALLFVGFLGGAVTVCIDARAWIKWRDGRLRGSLKLSDALAIGTKLNGV